MGMSAAWRQVAACLILLGLSGMIATTYSVLAVPFEQEFQPNRMVLMLATTALSLVGGAISPFCGSMMDRIPIRSIMGVGVLLLAAGFTAISFATSFPQIIVIYGLLMAPATILLGPIAAAVLLSRWFDKQRGRALGIAISGIAIGAALFPPLIQTLLDNHGWRDAMRLMALAIAIGALPIVALIADRPAEAGLARGERTAALPAMPSARSILSNPAFWLAAAIFAVLFSGMKGLVTNLVPLARDEGIPLDHAALLLTINAGSGFVGKMIFAAVGDRLGLRVLMALSIAGFASGMACMTMAGADYAAIAVAVSLIGLFGGMMVPIQGLLVGRVFGGQVIGKVSGLLNLVVLCALLVTPPLFGFLFDTTGSYDVAFSIFAGLAALSLLLIPYIRIGQPAAPAGAAA